jgi:ADP-ribosylglycohydrolase
MSERLQNIACELLPAVAYGDAFGVPVETKSAAEIAAQHGYITELLPTRDNPYFPGELDEGTTSDDERLTEAVIEAVVEARGFSLDSQQRALIKAYEETPKRMTPKGIKVRGWGGSTTNAVHNMMRGVSPERSGHPGGTGNGVVMKMSGLVVMQELLGLEPAVRYEQYDQLTNMTHDSDIARLCTRLHGDVVTAVLHDGLKAIPDAARRALAMSDGFGDERALLLRAVEQPCQSFEALVDRYAAGRGGKEYGFYVPETLAIVYDVALGSGGDFETAVQRAANLGGDADSTASIVASMIACSSGGEYEKPRDMHKVQNIEKLYVISSKLATIACAD